VLEKIKQFVVSLPPEYVFGIFIATLLAFPFFINYVRNQLKEEKQYIMKNLLTTKESIDSFKNEINEQLKFNPSLYKLLLKDVLNFLNKYLGPLKLFSYQAFDKHLLFSLIYSFVFLYLVWLFGGDGKIGTLEVIPNKNRVIVSLYLIFEIIIIYLLSSHAKQIRNFLAKQVPYFSHQSNTWQALLVAAIVVGVGVGVIAGWVVDVVGVVAAVVVGVGVVAAVVVGVVGVVTVVGVVVSTLINHIDPNTILYLLFFLILPLINAIFDYISMLFSRYFAKKILETHNKWKVFLDLVLDLLIAALLFVALALTLFYVIEFSNVHIIKDEALLIPIETYKTQLMSNPFDKDVLWITLMFVSTLLPTLMHLFLGLYSFVAFVLVKPHLHKLVEELNKLELKNNHKKEIVAKDLAQYRLADMMKVYIIIGMILVVAFSITLLMLLIKIGF